MTDIIDNAGGHRQVRYHDEADGTFSESEASHLRAWDSTAGAWVRVIVDHTTGALQTTGSGGGGGGAATIADGADVAQGTTTDLSTTNTVVGILKAIKAAITGTLTVATHAVTQSGVWTVARSWTLSSTTDSVNVGNFPATQPVSLATNTPDVTDRSARLLGHVTVDNASIPVTGTFFQATQPVSLATNTPDVTDRAARLLGVVDKGKVWDGTNIAAVKAASALVAATDPALVVQLSPQSAQAANLCVTNTAATGVACTLTIPSAGAGLFHYISLIEIQLYATAARTGGATPVLVTTTNLPGSPVWDFDTAQAIGATIRQTTQPATPIKSSVAATATTIVAPIATTGIWRITAYYYAAP